MAYSDYGSYNWKKENGKWIYHPEYEDANLLSQITGDEVSRDLVNVLGMPLKLGAVKHGMELEEQYPDLPFEIRGTHHSVIGDLKGFAVVSYKGHPTILWQGKNTEEQFEEKDFYNKDYSLLEKVKVVHLKRENCEVKVTIDTSENFWSMAYVRNGKDEYLSMCGYGLGDHWWLDENGKECANEGEDSDLQKTYDADTWEEIPNPKYRWPREAKCLQRTILTLLYDEKE